MRALQTHLLWVCTWKKHSLLWRTGFQTLQSWALWLDLESSVKADKLRRLLRKVLWWPTPGRTSPSCIAAAAAKSLQSCSTLFDPIDGSPPGSPIPGILQARTLEWVAISFSNAWKWKVKVKSLSPVQLLATPWTAAHQAPPSMGFSSQEYWSGLPLLSPLYCYDPARK